MRLIQRLKIVSKRLNSLSFLVLLLALCYPAYASAHPQPDLLDNASGVQVEKAHRITIELVEVTELDKVASFTQLLAKSTLLSDLQLSKVQLEAGQPERSLVRWSARLVSGSAEDLETNLQTAADSDGLTVIHRSSHRGFVRFALNAVKPGAEEVSAFNQRATRLMRPLQSGRGFD